MDVISALGLVVLLGVVAGIAGAVAYRAWKRRDAARTDETFTLADLRRLRDAGELTAEEYERARALVIGGLRPTGMDDIDMSGDEGTIGQGGSSEGGDGPSTDGKDDPEPPQPDNPTGT
jgi:hypothetical protein